MLNEDKRNGYLPFCIVATVGTTSTSSIDPIPEIIPIGEEHAMWLHVDAAYAGSAAVVPEFRHILAGCERADSLVDLRRVILLSDGGRIVRVSDVAEFIDTLGRVGRGGSVVDPALIQELVAGQGLAGMPQQAFEQRELTRAEVDVRALDRSRGPRR